MLESCLIKRQLAESAECGLMHVVRHPEKGIFQGTDDSGTAYFLSLDRMEAAGAIAPVYPIWLGYAYRKAGLAGRLSFDSHVVEVEPDLQVRNHGMAEDVSAWPYATSHLIRMALLQKNTVMPFDVFGSGLFKSIFNQLAGRAEQQTVFAPRLTLQTADLVPLNPVLATAAPEFS